MTAQNTPLALLLFHRSRKLLSVISVTGFFIMPINTP